MNIEPLPITAAFLDKNLLGYGIKDFSTYHAWIVFLAALFGLGLSAQQLDIFTRHTKRKDIPRKPFKTGMCISGRRSGKSYVAACIAVWLACFRDYREYLARGEWASVKVICVDRAQARVIMRFIIGLPQAPLLKQRVKRITANSIELQGNVIIEIATCDHRSLRGYTTVAAICDEACFYSSVDGASSAEQIFAALKPSMLTIPNSLLLVISSPWSRTGAVFELFDKWFGIENDHTLIWQADTLSMNPSIDPAEIAHEYELDAISASAEFGGQWRTDVEALLTKEVVDAATIQGRFELPFDPNIVYTAAIDASGGSSDSFTMAISHAVNGVGILDLVREVRPRFSPDAVCQEFSAVMADYRIGKCVGDRYGLEWVREGFNKYGIVLDFSELDLSAIFGNFLPLINAGRIQLLQNQRLHNQLLGLERRTTRGTKEIISHARNANAHDDIAASACMAMVRAVQSQNGLDTWINWSTSPVLADCYNGGGDYAGLSRFWGR
jgi:hypothetical protein